MIEQMDERVRVFVDFARATTDQMAGRQREVTSVRPVAFFYGGRKYIVERVNLVSEAGTGPTKRFSFSVSDAANSFTLEYNPFDLSWRLKETFTDG